jgi:hypothetical protein
MKCQGMYGNTACHNAADPAIRNWLEFPICKKCFELQADYEFGPGSEWEAEDKLIDQLEAEGKTDSEILEARLKLREEFKRA